VEENLLNTEGKPVHQFIATGNPDHFAQLARRFLGPEVTDVRKEINK
jgi:glutamate racemase